MPEEGVSSTCPFVWIECDSVEIIKRIAERSILIWRIFEVWGQGRNIEELIESTARCPTELAKPYEKSSFCFRVRSFGKSMKFAKEVELFNRFSFLPLKGEVKLKSPEVKLFFLLAHTISEQNLGEKRKSHDDSKVLHHAFFARMVAKGGRETNLKKFSLKKRTYLGPTSTDAELAFLMANSAHTRPGSIIYDPFVGTGSLLIAASHLGAYVVGADLDYRVLHPDRNEKGGDIFDNFQQYHLKRPEIIRSDATIPPWRSFLRFDAIVTDPPYGVRAGARRVGPKGRCKPIPEHCRLTHKPQTVVYEVDQVMQDLLDFAAHRLVLNGRICYLLPTDPGFDEKTHMPQHPCLSMVSYCRQLMSAGRSRYAVTMKKVKEPLAK